MFSLQYTMELKEEEAGKRRDGMEEAGKRRDGMEEAGKRRVGMMCEMDNHNLPYPCWIAGSPRASVCMCCRHTRTRTGYLDGGSILFR